MYVRSQDHKSIVKITDIDKITLTECDNSYSIFGCVGSDNTNIGVYSSIKICNDIMNNLSVILANQNRPRRFKLFTKNIYEMPIDTNFNIMDYDDDMIW